jgi:rod shape-determining protein MreC
MRHLPAEPPAFFHRGPSPLARLAFFGLVSVLLLFADTRYRYLETVRLYAAVVLYPLQQAAQVPGAALAQVNTYFATQRSLADENAALRQRLVEQAAAAQGFASERRENERLRTLLDVRGGVAAGAATVEVLYSGRDPFAQKLFVGKGAAATVKPGAAVIDADGVVGQVTRVYPHMAEVTLITDKDHAVPVKVERSGVRSVLYGAGTGNLPQLRFMSPNADVEVGDTLVTSGIDGTYPPGLAVAQVVALERNTGQMFARISARPLAGVDRSRLLLVLSEAEAPPPRPEEPAEVEAARKPGRGKARRP